MSGTGFNYIREIMQMNLSEESTPKPLREYESEAKKAKKFHYIGLTPYMPYDNNCRVKLMPAGMAGVIACSKDELTVCDASVNDVVQFCGRLYTFTDQKRWVQFVPGPCTDYDGPNPYEKTIYISTGNSIDSPITKAIRENLKKSLDMAGVIGYVDADNKTFVKEEKKMAKHNVFEESERRLAYIGTTTTAICENSTADRLYVEGTWVYSKPGYMVMYDGRLYVCAPDGKWHDLTATNVKTTCSTPTNYSKIPYGHLLINKVHYSGDKTIVMWGDGTKTMVTRGENEVFDPEKGLVMAIAKKAFGNQGNYYNQIKKYIPADHITHDEAFDKAAESVNKAKDKIRNDTYREVIDSVQELIIDMTYNGATKAELVKVIKYSKELIDAFKGKADESFNPMKLEKDYGIAELRAKYQPE